MKKYLFLFFIFSASNCLAQSKSGIAKYNLILTSDEGFSKSPVLKVNYNKAIEGAKKLSFTLTFNENESLFRLDDIIKDGLSGVNTALAYTLGEDIIYNSKNNFETITQSNSFMGIFLVKETKKTDWNLTQETKNIDGYLCYKATSTLIVDNGVKIFKFPIVAWYCPKIAVNFGPSGYNGLPGLILELQERNIIYGLKSIVFNKSNIKIEKPSKGKTVTAEELNSIMSGKFKD